MTTPDFYSLLEGNKEEPQDNTPDFYSLVKPKKMGEKQFRLGAQYAIGNIERLALPYDIAVSPLASQAAQVAEHRKNVFEDIERLQEQKQMGIWDEQDEELLQNLISQASDTEKSKKYVNTIDISSSGIIEKAFKEFGYDISPQGIDEYAARFGGNLFSPKNIKNFIQKGSKYLTKEGRQLAKTTSGWKSLERAVKGNPEKESILEFAKSKNLTPEESTLLIQSEGKVEKLGKIAKKTKKFKGVIESLKGKMQGSYDELKALGRSGGHISAEEGNRLAKDLGNVLEDVNRTIVMGPDTEAAKNIIEKTIKSVENNANTVEELINGRRNLRQFKNWNSLHEGDAIRKKAEMAIFNAIERVNPAIAKSLKQTDIAWAKYKKFEKLIKKPEHIQRWHGIPVGEAVPSIVFASLGLIGGGVSGAIKVYAAKEAIQRLSTRLLIDPKFQGIQKKMISALASGSQKKQKEILTVLSSVLKKEDPGLYQGLEKSVFNVE